jgi:site-specific DNA recombinase
MKDVLHIYCRVSSGVQEKGNSLEDQEQSGIRLSKQLGLNHRTWNEEGQTSKLDTLHNRPQMLGLLDEIDKGKVKHLYVISLDRLSRNESTSFNIKYKLIHNKVTLHTSTGQYDFDNYMDRFIYNTLSNSSVLENEMRRDKSVRGKISGMKKGHWKGGDINFGYKLVDKKLQINKEESVHVKKIYEMYENGKSTKDLQNYLLTNNIKTRRNNSLFPLQSITNILKNTIYIGYKDMKITDFHYRFECPPIVDESLFHKVQMRMKDILERKNQINRTQHEYLLRNYLYCNECKNGTSGLWREKLNQFNYFCSNRTRVWKGYKNGKEKCTMRRSLSIKQTDFLVWETICDTLENSSTLKESFKSTQLDTKFKSDKEVKNEVRRVRHNIQRISREINDLNENILLIEKQKWTNKMDEKTYKEVKSSIMENIQELESKRDSKELTITDTLTQKKWLNWIDRYSKKIDKYRDTKDKELMKEVFGEVLQKIFVDWDVETKEHVLDIRLKLPLFNDKIEYIDKTNKSLGYKLKDGKKSKELRYKKTNNVKRFIESKKKI